MKCVTTYPLNFYALKIDYTEEFDQKNTCLRLEKFILFMGSISKELGQNGVVFTFDKVMMIQIYLEFDINKGFIF